MLGLLVVGFSLVPGAVGAVTTPGGAHTRTTQTPAAAGLALSPEESPAPTPLTGDEPPQATAGVALAPAPATPGEPQPAPARVEPTSAPAVEPPPATESAPPPRLIGSVYVSPMTAVPERLSAWATLHVIPFVDVQGGVSFYPGTFGWWVRGGPRVLVDDWRDTSSHGVTLRLALLAGYRAVRD